MKLLITGGSGFVGKNLIEYFGEKYDILSPTRAELDLIDSIAVENYFKNNNIDIMVHSAVRPGHRNAKDPSKQLEQNTRMFFNIARNEKKFKKMIFLSSGLVYGIDHYLPKMKEEYFDVNVPDDEGGFSKYLCAKYLEKTDNIVELRPFGVFGKYEDYAIRFISNAICKTIFDLPITIKQNRKFDYISIDDLCLVIEHFIVCTNKHKAYNIAPDRSIELKEIAKIVLKVSKKDLPIKIQQEGQETEYSGDNSRLKTEIEGLKLTPIEESIRKLYDWYVENKSKIDKELLLFDK
ncbi:NAD(P)-dependent oxidoreductase [Candidatus Saganbacteria bacterium]|nr:NAD(P)-dependent oxidoreductase [Candidatus Saganbacteria bacterium]